MSTFLNSLYIWMLALYWIWSCENILFFCRLPFCPVAGVLSLIEDFTFIWPHILLPYLSAGSVSFLLREFPPIPIYSKLCFYFSSFLFSVSDFMMRSLKYLDFNFVQVDKYGSICILLYVDNQWIQHHLLKIFSFFYCVFLDPYKKIQVSTEVWINVWVFD